MSIQIEWLDGYDHILRYEVISPWTMEEFYDAIKEGYAMSAHLERLSIIFDVTRGTSIPVGFFSARDYMNRMKQSNVDVRVLVGGNALINSIIKVFSIATPQLIDGLKTARTLPAAIAMIEQERPTMHTPQ